MFSKWHHCRPTFSETGSRYVVLVGDVRAGKSTLTEKLTNVPCLKSDQSRSFTTNSDIFRTADGMLEICDTPGTNPLEDKFTHNIWIAQAFNRKPVSLLLIVVKADRGISNVIDSVTKYAEGFFDIFHILGVCVTHMDDDGITWTEGNFKEALSELGLESVIFSSSTSTGDDLRRDVEAICSRKPEDVSVDSENFFKFFKLNDSNFKLLHSVRKEVQRLEMVIRKFQDIYGMREDSDSSQLDLLFEFALWMRAWILGAQCRVSADTSYVKGPEKASEAGHLTNLTNQLTDVLMELWTEIETFSDIRDDSFRKCPHCGKIWAKSNECDLYCWEGSRCIGNSTYEREQMFNLCRQIKNDADEGLVLVGETGSFVFRWTDSSSKLEIDSIGPNNEDDEDDKLNATASFKSFKPRHNDRGCKNRLDWKDMAPSKVPQEFEVAEDAMEVSGNYVSDERDTKNKGRDTVINTGRAVNGATAARYRNFSADHYSSRKVSGLTNMGWESTFRKEMYSCWLSRIPLVATAEPSVNYRKTSDADAGLTKSTHVSTLTRANKSYDRSIYTSPETHGSIGRAPFDDCVKSNRFWSKAASEGDKVITDEKNKAYLSRKNLTLPIHSERRNAKDPREESPDHVNRMRSLSEDVEINNAQQNQNYLSHKNCNLATHGERSAITEESSKRVKGIPFNSEARSEDFKLNIDGLANSKYGDSDSTCKVLEKENLSEHKNNLRSSLTILTHGISSSSSFDKTSSPVSISQVESFKSNMNDFVGEVTVNIANNIEYDTHNISGAISKSNCHPNQPKNGRLETDREAYSKSDFPYDFNDHRNHHRNADPLSESFDKPSTSGGPIKGSRTSNYESQTVSYENGIDREIESWKAARSSFNIERLNSGKNNNYVEPSNQVNNNINNIDRRLTAPREKEVAASSCNNKNSSKTFYRDRSPNHDRLDRGISDQRTRNISYTRRPVSSYSCASHGTILNLRTQDGNNTSTPFYERCNEIIERIERLLSFTK